MRNCRLIRFYSLASVACALLALPYDLQAEDREKTTIDIGSEKQLFIDDRFVESSSGVTLTMNPPRRDEQLLLVADQPWEEGFTIQVYSSVLKEDGKVKIWYDMRRQLSEDPYDQARRVGYAESEDGLYFTKPHLGLHEINGSTDNNIVLPGVIGGCSVWVDPLAAPEHRYKTQAKVYPSGQFHMHSSPDGLRWKLFSKQNSGPGGHDTQSIVFWDANVHRYALFTRAWTQHSDKTLLHRRVRRLESDDLKTKWDSERIVLAADEVDRATHPMPTERPPVDYYGACVFPYEENQHVYFMLAQAFWHWRERAPLKGLGPASFDVRLAYSRDGKNFQRLGQWSPFMANGPDGSFDSLYVWAMPNPVRMEDELWIYYVGSNRDHDRNIDPAAPDGKALSGIGRAVLRLDGFVSADAGYRGGELTTPPLRFSGQRLELNVATSAGGSVEVELLDEQAQPIAGYAKADANIINGNSVRMPVRWKATDDVSKLTGSPVRLRFHLRDCKLYAFQFRE